MLGTIFYVSLWLGLNLLRMLGLLRWRVEGLEHIPLNGGAVLVSNHVHWLDIPVHGVLMPLGRKPRWVAKAELLDSLFGRLFLRTYMIPIRRGKRDVDALDAAVESLRAGNLVLIYPEGTRSGTGVLQKGKPGALVLAAKSGRPLVPLAVTGTELGLRGVMRFHPIVVRFGPPFPAPDLAGGNPSLRSLALHTSAMMRQIAALLPEEQRGPYGLLAEAAPAQAARQ